MSTFSCDAGVLLRETLHGSPVAVGAHVVVRSCDDTGDERFLGRAGVVTGLFFDDPVVQLPHAPLVVVHVDGLGEELFHARELEVDAPRSRARA